MSPDDTRVALDIRDADSDIWIWDLARETLQRLTFDPGRNRGPAWTPDGQRVVFSRGIQGETEEIYWQAADGSGAAEPLTAGSMRGVQPSDFSPDAAALVYEQNSAPRDIWIVPVGNSPGAGQALLETPTNESSAEISPDGRWLAYHSDESGQYEIYVRPFPAVDTGRQQISTGGGTRPRWSRDGRELFYYLRQRAGGALMAVPIESGPSFTAGRPQMLFEGDYRAPNNGRQVYDVSADGARFLMIKGAGDDEAAPRQMVLVQNWHQELLRLVPIP